MSTSPEAYVLLYIEKSETDETLLSAGSLFDKGRQQTAVLFSQKPQRVTRTDMS